MTQIPPNIQKEHSHQTVLLQEAVQALVHKPEGMYIDGTFGRGGHSRLILQNLNAEGRLLAFDRDPQAIEAAGGIHDARFSIQHEAFSSMADMGDASVDGILLDLGISSPQIDDPQRGFSFRYDGPLDMRMDTTRGESVAQWLEYASSADIERVIRDYGEERFAKKIAQKIVDHIAAGQKLITTLQLANLVAGVVRVRDGNQHPATRTFQAFRIFINDELQQLKDALQVCLRLLKAGGRLVVISFHSLEDRMVKQFMQQHARETVDRNDAAWMLRPSASHSLRLLGKVKPGKDELERNPRARSAIMRIAERTEADFVAVSARGAVA